MANFRPNATISDLLGGKCQSSESIRVVGRVRDPIKNGFTLVDGETHLFVELLVDPKKTLREFAWVGVQGRWVPQKKSLDSASVMFLSNPIISAKEVSNQNLPEVDLLLHPERLNAIQTRSSLLKWLRCFMEENGFAEVQTPFLRSAAEVAYLKQYEIDSISGRKLFLRTDPEEYLKRYLTAGLDAVYEIATNVRVERPNESSLQEFTSLECYKRFWMFEEVLRTCMKLLQGSLQALRGDTRTKLSGRSIDLSETKVKAYKDLVSEHTGILLDEYSSAEVLASEIRKCEWWEGTGGPLDRFKRTWLEWLFANRVIPKIDQPTIVVDFPQELGLSYKNHPSQLGACLRAELYLPGGFELVHFYENLVDTEALRHRYKERLLYRIAGGLKPVTLDEGLLTSAALGMPPMGGIAVGVDRLLLLIMGEGTVGDGLLFPREGF